MYPRACGASKAFTKARTPAPPQRKIFLCKPLPLRKTTRRPMSSWPQMQRRAWQREAFWPWMAVPQFAAPAPDFQEAKAFLIRGQRLSNPNPPSTFPEIDSTPLPPLIQADASIAVYRAGELFAPDCSFVDRRIFVDEDLYRLEQEKIFAKCWLYLGHESALHANGSFLTTTMGEDHVILVRDQTGCLRVYLNS